MQWWALSNGIHWVKQTLHHLEVTGLLKTRWLATWKTILSYYHLVRYNYLDIYLLETYSSYTLNKKVYDSVSSTARIHESRIQAIEVSVARLSITPNTLLSECLLSLSTLSFSKKDI